MADPVPTYANPWLILLPVVVGGLLTFLGGLIGNFLLQWNQRKAEIKSLTGAFVGEIRALLSIVERRRYLEGIEQLIQQVRTTNQPATYSFSARRNPFSVYDSNVSRIGILPSPLPELICRFYSQSRSVLEDIDDMRNPQAGTWTAAESLSRLEELRDLLRDSNNLANEIIRVAGGR